MCVSPSRVSLRGNSPSSLFLLLFSACLRFAAVDATDRKGATALLYACRALALLPSCNASHPLFAWAQELLTSLVAAGADTHYRDDTGACPAVLGASQQQRQRDLFLERGSLYEAVWPSVRAQAKALAAARYGGGGSRSSSRAMALSSENRAPAERSKKPTPPVAHLFGAARPGYALRAGESISPAIARATAGPLLPVSPSL